MTPNQIIQAHQAIQQLSSLVLPYRAAREIAGLKKRLVEEFETVFHAELALLERHGGEVKQNGEYRFPDDGAAETFAKECTAFRAQEDDIRLPIVDLSGHASAIRISASAVEALEGLVKFEGEAERDG